MVAHLCAHNQGHETFSGEQMRGMSPPTSTRLQVMRCDMSGVVTLEGHDNLKVLFREHFQHLFLAFVMARHTRLGSDISLAPEHGLLKDVVANVDLLQMVLEQGLSLYQ